MRLAIRIRSWIAAATRRSHLEQSIEEEMSFHVDAHARNLMGQGLSSVEAQARARAEFGVVEARKDEVRDALGLTWLDDVRADLRYAVRLLRQSPGFTAVAVLSLALGIGANTAVFSLMETIAWKSLPVRDPQQLRLLTWVSGPHSVDTSNWNTWGQRVAYGDGGNVFSFPVWRGLHSASADVFAFKPAGLITATIDGRPELVKTEMLSGNAFQVEGVVPVAGRPITSRDDADGSPVVAVITETYWAERFARDPAVIGKRIELNRVPVTIVGIAPRGYVGMDPEEHPAVFIPIASQPLVSPFQYARDPHGSLLKDPDLWWVQLMARVPSEENEKRKLAQLDAVLRRVVWDSMPASHKRDQPRLRFENGSRGLDVVRFEFEKPMLILACLAGIVLLIACANLANLLLARATARHREIAVRLALGAGRTRVIRQMFTEGLLLTTLGSGVGIVLGYCMRDGIPLLLAAPWSAAPFRADFDWRVLLISVAVGALTGILFSIAPAWRSSHVPAHAALKEGSRSTMSGPHVFAGRALVVLQISLSLILLVGAGLFLHTLQNLKTTDLGFNPSRVLLFDVDPPRARYAGEKRVAFYEELLRRFQSVSGVQSVTGSQDALVSGASSDTTFTIPGPPHEKHRDAMTWINSVGPAFFMTLQLPIVNGRPVNAWDRVGSPLVAVVNREFARKFFRGENPIGRTLVRDSRSYTIIGVASDAHFSDVRSPVPPTVYTAFAQEHDLSRLTFAVKTAAGTSIVMQGVRDVVASIDRDVPVFDVRTQKEQIDATMSQERLLAALTTTFGLLALTLAAVGVYGIIAYSVTRRTGEIGIRIALGAQRDQILRLVLRECAVVVAVGITLGLLAATLVTTYIRTFLYGLTPADPFALSLSVALLACIAITAAWVPARRASRMDSMNALRHE